MALELGVILPTSSPDSGQPILGDVRQSARFAEEAGIDSVWATDHLIASAPMLDSGIALATAAGATERIGIGFDVMLLALRRTAWAAKQISSLQHVSGGRLTLGVGTGNPAHGDIGWRAAGLPYEGRGRRTDEALRILPDLVAGRPATLEDGTEVVLEPGATMPPVLIAGNGGVAKRRAARFGDGWIPLLLSPQELAADMAELKALAELEGRPAPAATVVGPRLDTGDPRAAADRLVEYARVGAERVILVPTGPDWKRDYEFAATVREALRDRAVDVSE